MAILYTIGIYLMGVFYRLAAVFVPKARAWRAGRKQWRKHLQEALADWSPEQPRIWMHCASLGEFEQGRPLIEKIKQERPETRILLTFFSPSGYSIRKDYVHADFVMYLPLDLPRNTRDFLRIVKPDLGIFVKYEFWWNYIASAKKAGIPLVLIAGLFRPKQYFFQFYGSWFRRQLASFKHFFVQNEAAAQLLQEVNISAVSVVGDPRVDRVLQIAAQVPSFPKIEQWRANRPTLVVGSSWPSDEEILFPFLVNTLPQDWAVILAPHDISTRHIQQIEHSLPLSFEKYSDWTATDPSDSRVLLIDNIGMLSGLYQYGRIAYIGGGFGAGIHNTLEPMAFSLPVIFGPRFEKFEEARLTVAGGGAFTIGDTGELNRVFLALQQGAQYQKSQAMVEDYLQSSRDATLKIYRSLQSRQFLPE
jgi:3-deoxy-D-manno-octulosonic-acid transferase